MKKLCKMTTTYPTDPAPDFNAWREHISKTQLPVEKLIATVQAITAHMKSMEHDGIAALLTGAVEMYRFEMNELNGCDKK